MNRRLKGTEWEEKAADYLADMGYRILQMNYKCRIGEIDIIARDGGYYVFAEVKYRNSDEYGSPFEAVTPAKQRRIRRVAQMYLLEHGISMYVNCRFDVIGILNGEITLLKDAF